MVEMNPQVADNLTKVITSPEQHDQSDNPETSTMRPDNTAGMITAARRPAS
jgi:hypothetical protein